MLTKIKTSTQTKRIPKTEHEQNDLNIITVNNCLQQLFTFFMLTLANVKLEDLLILLLLMFHKNIKI